MDKETRAKVQDLVDRGAIFYVNHSGGKDSQAMYHVMREIVPDDQLVVIHAVLPEVDWVGTADHVQATITHQYIECQAVKTFFEMVDHRGKFPAPKWRQCTSDLKRGPIDKAIRADLKDKDKKLAVNCIGLRAEESSHRAKATVFKKHARLSKAGREVYELLPIHELKEAEVFNIIYLNGQEPHWAYLKGMTRLSCCFCIMASKKDLTTAARLNPELYRRYVLKERELNFTLQDGKTLEETTGIKIEEV